MPALSPKDIAACITGPPRPPSHRWGGPLGSGTPSSPCPSLGVDGSRSLAGLNRFSSSRTKGFLLDCSTGKASTEGGREAGKPEAERTCGCCGTGFRDPSQCRGAQLGRRAGLAPAHGGIQGLGGSTGPLLATSPWDVQGGRREEAHDSSEWSP